MPTYQYVCTACDQPLEAVQSFSDAALTECPACSGRLRKVYGAVGVVFKGSGFYKTDSRDAAKKAETPAAKSDGASSPSSSSDGGGSGSSSSTPAPSATPSTASSSSSGSGSANGSKGSNGAKGSSGSGGSSSSSTSGSGAGKGS